MAVKNNKWEKFKATYSNLNVANPNVGESNLQADWNRAIHGKFSININGVSLKIMAGKYNNFQEEKDVLDFFEEIVLRDFVGDNIERKNAVQYLKKAFHQGGLLYPVSSALSTELKDRDGNIACTLVSESRDSLVNIKTTRNGFKIQEYSEARHLVAIAESLNAYASEGKIGPEEGKSSVIMAEATIAIDFSKSGASPSLFVEGNHMEILHEGLKLHLDNRTLGQKLVDFFKSILGFDKIKSLSPIALDNINQPEEGVEQQVPSCQL
ncbi:hypothetical protein [Legionella feeleii]|uniref:Uncharacterized protein n=1 Tax=Legionella feeleii TaxID=453 RepID=A0A378IQT7_9GAMM|nr:hypothetical protein [Legionella feeleii]STX37310.1 Uncharacterised protein [Legionella feeleii]